MNWPWATRREYLDLKLDIAKENVSMLKALKTELLGLRREMKEAPKLVKEIAVHKKSIRDYKKRVKSLECQVREPAMGKCPHCKKHFNYIKQVK